MKLGGNMKLYLDPSGVGGSSWTEYTYVEQDSLNEERTAAEIRNRASDYVKVLGGKLNSTIELTATYHKGNAQYEALRDAFINNADIGVAVMTGTITDAGEEGLQADCKVVAFNKPRPLEEGASFSFTLRPSAESTTEPAYTEIST